MKPMNENSSIIYNNVNNITYQGTQAQGGTFIYNNVANIQKEAVELRNRYSSESSGFGVGVSAGIGSNGQIKSNGISGNISANRSNRNTVETIHANGSFTNVNEVHNNTGTMTLSGFNQEGGKVTGNIGKVEVISRQNTSTTTGSSKGVNLGISANGVPSSVTINASRTNGNRAFVDNQSTFVVGEGSNLHVGTVENTGAIIGKEGNSTFKIDTYAGKDIQNYDTMTTTGGSIGVSLGGNPKITNVGFNQDSRDKQGITRNTVVGDVEITKAEGSPINRDLGKANEVTKDTHSRTNINIEPQVIEYISNPAKFKEDLEVAILEGKATGETVLKSIENIVNGGKEDIGDPERRAINEIKEAVIRVKTAPQMESIAKAKDLNSPDILEKLDIAAIEKYDPYDPNLPIKVRQRVEKTLKDGKIPGVFYDEITNKIFVYKGMEDDLKIRAGIAREWKISEDLKNEKGKPNEEGRLKATVAGELAYDDMMKRGREGKTESISTDRFADAIMDEDSEVTADNSLHLNKADNRAGNAVNKPSERRTPFRRTRKKKNQEAMKKNNGFTIWNEPRRKAIETLGYFSIGDGSQKLTDESKEMIVREGFLHTFITRNLKYEKTPDKIYSEQPEVKKKIEELQKKAKEKSDKNTTYYVRVDSKNKTVTLESSPTTKNPLYHFRNDVIKGPVKGVGNLVEAERLTWTGHPIKGVLKGLEGTGNILGATTLGIGSFLGDFADRYTPGEVQYGTSEEVNRRQKTENLAVRLPIDILVSRAVNGLISKQFKMNKAGNTNREVATVENASKGTEYMRKDSIFINDGTPGGTVKFESQVVGNSNYELSKITNTYNGNTVVKATNKVTGEIHSFKNFGNTQAGNSLSITNTNTFLVPFNPNVSTGVTVTTSSSVRTAIGSVGANLITSVKSVTTPEVPKNPEVKPFIKPEQNIETVKKPAVTSEKPKTVERSHSQGSGNQIDEKRILEKWGKAADGTNQGKKHFYEYWKSQPKRIYSLEDRLGVPKGTFENSAEGFKNFTEQAERVIKKAEINGNTIVEENGKKTTYFIEGVGKNPREGVKVIMYDGKIQSMMPFKIPAK